MAFFKRLLDVVNHEHWGLERLRGEALAPFAEKYQVVFDEAALASIHSLEFINSHCTIAKRPAAENVLGLRRAGGEEALVSDAPALDEPRKVPEQTANPWSGSVTQEEEIVNSRMLSQRYAEQKSQILDLTARLRAEESRVSALNAMLQNKSKSLSEIRNSTSWRLTAPLRTRSPVVRQPLVLGRKTTRASWLLISGRWREFALGLLPYYQRHVPLAVKEMIPRATAEGLKRRIDKSRHEASQRIPGPALLWARFKRDLNRKSRTGARGAKRVAVFAAYSSESVVPDHVVHYLSELRKVVDAIIFVADNELPEREIDKIAHLVVHHITGRHGEYDFGSYKRGYFYAKGAGLLEPDSDLILCNDSCFGPLNGFEDMMSRMTMESYDFWGITESKRFCYHLQSYFLYFSSVVYRHPYFDEFMKGIKKHDSVQDVIKNYELKLTDALIKKGFRAKALIDASSVEGLPTEQKLSIEHFPRFMVENGSPLFKVKSLTKARCNLEGVNDTFDFLKARNKSLYGQILALPAAKRFLASERVSFSVILPTLNRAHCINDAIGSVLAQSHQNFELIIVDDGSSDGTGDMLRQRYADEIAAGKIVYIDEGHGGISAARNKGLRAAKNEWIAYLDSDNTIRRGFLSTFAQHVVEFPDVNVFYGMFKRKGDKAIIGKDFNYQELLRGNYIDLGIFVHHKSCFDTRGGFDEELRRLVDWDLILNYTEAYPPQFIPHVLMDYSAADDPNRISIKESLSPAWFHVLAKWKHQPKVSTVILSYNQRQYIAEAIESALRQKGSINHEIVISDDGSTDGTREIIQDYAERYPHLIRDVSSTENRGISENYRHALSAADGEFVAILEGDDYWIDNNKLEAQVAFLLQNRDCSMVFSKIRVHNLMRDTMRTLSRQDALKKKKLSGRDFLDHPTMNLIGTFSTCMFRKEHLVRFPPVLFENRISEIPVAFYHDNHGRIGYLDEPMTLYRQHPAGVWSSSTAANQKRSGRETRRVAKAVARDIYKNDIQRVIDERYAD